MDSRHRRPQHASYRLHRRQLAWQILLPVVLAALIIIGLAVLVSMAAFGGNSELARWADVSAMWLAIPFMVGSLVLMAVLFGAAYLVGRAAGFIPPYTHKAQMFVFEVEARVQRGVQYAYRPTRILSHIGHIIKERIRRIRGR